MNKIPSSRIFFLMFRSEMQYIYNEKFVHLDCISY